MGKRKNNTLVRQTGQRVYRPVCWVSAGGATERDYFRMAAMTRRLLRRRLLRRC